MQFKSLIQPSFICFTKGILFRSSLRKESLQTLIFSNFSSAKHSSSKWGSKSKKDKRQIPLQSSLDMSLNPDQEALLAPYRARVKEQVNIKFFLEITINGHKNETGLLYLKVSIQISSILQAVSLFLT